ncbi:hypothetical protein RHMOL_Rhmol08G0275200 [Rhododendron molle]|uniref:Uncharacterized protein n=2 Tax=Rhododendron molle TaxID=49168 RepID=A0ACC0MT09_RHOML|nr:hypothetical protein RHMOL_Rhmol08G0275200 [Rhododendron molle]KAI8544173.1 hypothetical protein RHMOL_Rhmol08G0275200 [Rhododendron molle]
MIIWDKAEVIKVSDNALEHLEVPRGDKGCRYCTKLEEIGMMISEIDSYGNAHIDLNGKMEYFLGYGRSWLKVNLSFILTVLVRRASVLGALLHSKAEGNGLSEDLYSALLSLPRLEEVFEQLLAYVALAFWGWSGKERKLLLFRRHLTNAIAMTTIKCQGLI